MVHFKLTKKNVKRLVTTMLLIAPIIYLFGSLFTGLNGAHGQQIFADGEETSQKSYDELMEVENFNYGSFDWTNEHGTRLGFSLGYYSLSYFIGYDTFFVFTPHGVRVQTNNISNNNHGLGFTGYDSDDFMTAYVSDDFSMDDWDASYSSSTIYSCCYFVPPYSSGFQAYYAFVASYDFDLDVITLYSYYLDGQINTWERNVVNSFALDDRDDWFVYFDDGAHLPEGVSWNDELASYFVPKVKVSETQTYSDYVFGQFFARDNFVSKIGEDALSDDPHGFAPFATMLRFVDENMLNIGSLQVGLMAYGYFYWCAHVLLLMVLFDLTTFFLTWVSHIGDKFGGNADE